jgi:predicted AAA+ superfamily ATPase
LLPYLKMAVDNVATPGLYWLTGSQHFLAMRDITETLAGRVAIINLLGFSRRESEQRTSSLEPLLPSLECVDERMTTAADSSINAVFKSIWMGSFPALVAGPVHDRDLFYSSYVQTYLQRDVRDLTQVGSQQTFLRFLRACAARTGQLLNLSDLARDVDVSVPTAKAWLSILEDSFQVLLLRPYFSNLTKRLVKTPKLYFLDTGLVSYLTEWSSPQTLGAGAMAGALLETFVIVEILKSYWHRLRQPSLYFYRDRDRKEIDVVLAHDGALHAIEVKLAATPNRRWAGQFQVLERLGVPVASKAVACLCPEVLPLGEQVLTLPIGGI